MGNTLSQPVSVNISDTTETVREQSYASVVTRPVPVINLDVRKVVNNPEVMSNDSVVTEKIHNPFKMVRYLPTSDV